MICHAAGIPHLIKQVSKPSVMHTSLCKRRSAANEFAPRTDAAGSGPRRRSDEARRARRTLTGRFRFLRTAKFRRCLRVPLDRRRTRPLEDLVLHGAICDIRTPTHQLTIARDVLRTRWRIAEAAQLGAQPGRSPQPTRPQRCCRAGVGCSIIW